MILLILSSLWFWLALAGLVCLFVATARESLIGGLITIVVTLATIQFLTAVDIIGWVKANQNAVLIGTAIYFPIGTGWSFVKWYFKLKDEREKVLERKENELNELLKEAKVLRDNHKAYTRYNIKHQDVAGKTDDELFEVVLLYWKESVKKNRPKSAQHKERIMSWIGYWPISIIWTFLDDFLTAIVRNIYNHVSGVFNKMSEKMFSDV